MIAHSPFFLTQTAMVAMVAAGSVGSYHPATDLAGKAVVAGMGSIISFFVLFSFVFSVHNGDSS